MPDWQTFFSMGGYGAYVWSAYGITFVVLLLNFLSTRIAHSRQCQELRRDLLRQDKKSKREAST